MQHNNRFARVSRPTSESSQKDEKPFINVDISFHRSKQMNRLVHMNMNILS